MKRTRRREIPPQGLRFGVSFEVGYAHCFLVTKRPRPGQTLGSLARGLELLDEPTATKWLSTTWPFSTQAREAIRRVLSESEATELERALSAPILRPPNDLSAQRRAVAQKYSSLSGHLGKARDILQGDDLFTELDLGFLFWNIQTLLDEAEKRRLALLDCKETGESFRAWEEMRRQRVVGTVFSVLELSGEPTGGPRAARIMETVMEHFFGRKLADPKRALARYRSWWKGLSPQKREGLLSRVRSGVLQE